MKKLSYADHKVVCPEPILCGTIHKYKWHCLTCGQTIYFPEDNLPAKDRIKQAIAWYTLMIQRITEKVEEGIGNWATVEKIENLRSELIDQAMAKGIVF